jgi:hypothetical protein
MGKFQPNEPIPSFGKGLTHKLLEKRKLCCSATAAGLRHKFNCRTIKFNFRRHKTPKSAKESFSDKISTRRPIFKSTSRFTQVHDRFPNSRVAFDQKGSLQLRYVTSCIAKTANINGEKLESFLHSCAGDSSMIDRNKKHSHRSETALARKQCKGKKERPEKVVES